MRLVRSRKVRKRIPIRTRFLTTVLLTTVISILTVSATGFFCIRGLRRATEKILTEQLETNLKTGMQEKLRFLNAKLEHYEKNVELIADYIDKLYRSREEYLSSGRRILPPRDTREYALTRGFVSGDLRPEDLEEEMLLFSHLETLWAPILQENDQLISTAYLGSKNGLLVSYDRYSYLSVPPEGEELVYYYYASEWYREGMKQDEVFFTGVYVDSQGRGLTMTAAAPFHDARGERAGVACVDFDLSTLCRELFSSGPGDESFIFALDRQGTVISPDSDTLELQKYTGLNLDELDALRSDPDGIMEKGENVYVCLPVERFGWTLCACVPKGAVQKGIYDADSSIRSMFIIFSGAVLLILMAAVVAVNKSVRYVTYPLELLGRDIKIISNGNLDYRASVFRNDEIGDITSGMNEMVDRLNFTLKELMSSQQQADAMSRLATRDSLTGIRNKTAFDRQTTLLKEDLARGETEFGFVLLDLNNLKLINDNFGHEKGDIAIRSLCHIICEVFSHSPVFRIGGDEFVVVLKNADYQNIQELEKRFKDKIRAASGDRNGEPWDRVSAAMGYALYDPQVDSGTESVLSRADMEMYACKKAMKGL